MMRFPWLPQRIQVLPVPCPARADKPMMRWSMLAATLHTRWVGDIFLWPICISYACWECCQLLFMHLGQSNSGLMCPGC